MAGADDSELSEQPSSSPSAGSTVPLGSSELGSDRAASPGAGAGREPTPSSSRARAKGSMKAAAAAEKKVKSSHSRNNSIASGSAKPISRGAKASKAKGSTSRATSVSATDRAGSIKAESVPPTSHSARGSMPPPVPAAPRISRVSSTADDSPSPPHHLNTSHGDLPLFEQPIVLEGGRSRRLASSTIPPAAPVAAAMMSKPKRKGTEPPLANATGQAPHGKRTVRGGASRVSAAIAAPGRRSSAKGKAKATDGDSSLTEQSSEEEEDEEEEDEEAEAEEEESSARGTPASVKKGVKRSRELDDDEDPSLARPNGGGKAKKGKLASSATSTSLSEAGSENIVAATITAPPPRSRQASASGSASGSGSGSGSMSAAAKGINRSPHATLFQGETERWGLPPGEGRSRRTAVGKSSLSRPVSPSKSTTAPPTTPKPATGKRTRRRKGRFSSEGSTLTPEAEEEDLTAAGVTKTEDTNMTPAEAGAEGSEDPGHFAMPTTLASQFLGGRHGSRSTSPSSSKGPSPSSGEQGPSPPTPLPPHSDASDSAVGAALLGGGQRGTSPQKELDAVLDAAAGAGPDGATAVVQSMRSLVDRGVEPVMIEGGTGGADGIEIKEGEDALESVLQAAVEGRPLRGALAEAGPEAGTDIRDDEEVEEEEEEEEEEEGEEAEVPQVVVVEAPTPTQAMKTRHARSPPEFTDAQDAYNIKRTEATERLAKIEIAFANVRNRLYVERTADVLRERAAVEAGVHPELNAYVDTLRRKRERKLDQARKRIEAREAALANRREAAEVSVWNQWNEAKVGLRSEMIAETHRQLRQLEREKNQPEMIRPYVESQLAPRDILGGGPFGGLKRKRTAGERDMEREEDLAIALRIAVSGRTVPDLSSLPEEDRLADLRRMAARPTAADLAMGLQAEPVPFYGPMYPIDPMMGAYPAPLAPGPPPAEPPGPPPASINPPSRPPSDPAQRHHRRPTLDSVMSERPRAFPSAHQAAPQAAAVRPF